MLSQAQRTAILELHAKGVSRHEISRVLQVSRPTRYGLYDLDRLERMILRRVARDYFLIGEKDPESYD